MNTKQNNTQIPPKERFTLNKNLNPKIWAPIIITFFILGVISTFAWNGSINLRVDSRKFSGASDFIFNSCKSDKDCGYNKYCNFKTCNGARGKCIKAPINCSQEDDPVCGCDGKTYSNDCNRQMAKISQDHMGECEIELTDTPYIFFNLHIHPENANDEDFVILEELIKLADSYNTKLTLGFHIQFIDMILADPIKTKKVKGWQNNGHEIAIEHHSANHGGWDGYSNLPEDIAIKVYKTFFPGSPIIYPYSGTFDEAYARFNQLAYPNTVKSGATALKSEMPIGHIYDLDSLKTAPWAEGRTSKAVVNMFNNQLTYRINVRSGYLNDDWKTNVKECDKATPDEVCGFIAHLSDYADDRFKTAKDVWGYYYGKDPEGKKRKTASWIMENHIIPNDLIIHERCGNTVCDDEEFETKSCPIDCNACDKMRFGDYWVNIHEGATYNCDVGDSHKIYLKGRTAEVCGDGICNNYQGENKDNCPEDCVK